MIFKLKIYKKIMNDMVVVIGKINF